MGDIHVMSIEEDQEEKVGGTERMGTWNWKRMECLPERTPAAGRVDAVVAHGFEEDYLKTVAQANWSPRR